MALTYRVIFLVEILIPHLRSILPPCWARRAETPTLGLHRISGEPKLQPLVYIALQPPDYMDAALRFI